MATRLQAIIDFAYKGGGIENAIGDMSKLAQGIGQVGRSATQMSVESAALDARTSLLSDKMNKLALAVAENKMTVEAATSEYQKFESKLISIPPKVEQTSTAFQRMKGTLSDATGAWMAIATPIQSTIQTLQQVGQAAQQAYQYVSEGTQLATTAHQFDALAVSIGSTADALLGELKTATRGTISDANLMASATSIMSLGLADTSEETVRLASLVGKLGWDMNQVTLTLANQSTMRLDSLGLSVEDVTGRIDALKAAGYSADQAFKFAILEAGEEKVQLLGDAADTAAGKLKILETNVANAGDSFKMAFSQQIITDVNSMAGGLFEASDSAQQFADAGRFVSGVIYQWLDPFGKARDSIDAASGKFDGGVVSIKAHKGAVEESRAAMIASMTAIDDRREAIDGHNDALAAAITLESQHASLLYQQTSPAYAELQDKVTQTNSLLSEEEAAFRQVQQEVEEANAAFYAQVDASNAVTGAIYASTEAIAAYTATTGDYATMAIQAGEEGVNLNAVMYDSLDAAGGSAEALVGLALATGQLTEAQAENILKQAAMIEYAQGLGEQLAAGTISISDAVTSLSNFEASLETSNVLINTATGSVGLFDESMVGAGGSADVLAGKLDGATVYSQKFIDTLNAIPKNIDVQVNVHGGEGITTHGGYQTPGDTGDPSQSGGTGYGGGGNVGDGFASGADFIVPPGYPNDSYPMRVQSGEHVKVTPAGQSSGGDTYNLYVTAMDGGANVAREFNYLKSLAGA